MSFEILKRVSLRNKYSCYGWIREHENMLKLSQIPALVKSLCIMYFRDDDMFDKTSTRGGVFISSNKKIVSRKDANEIHMNVPCNSILLDGDRSLLELLCDDDEFEEAPINNNHGITEIDSDQNIKVQWKLKATNLIHRNEKTSYIPFFHGSNIGNILVGISNKDDHVNQVIHDTHSIYYLFQWSIGQKRLVKDFQNACRFYWFDPQQKHDPKCCEFGMSNIESYGSDEYRRNRSDDGSDVLSLHLDLEQAKIKFIVNGNDFGFRQVNIVKSPDIKYKLCVILDGVGQSVEILDFQTY